MWRGERCRILWCLTAYKMVSHSSHKSHKVCWNSEKTPSITSGSVTITSIGFSLPLPLSRVSGIARTGAHSGGPLLKDPLYCSLLTVPYLRISLLLCCVVRFGHLHFIFLSVKCRSCTMASNFKASMLISSACTNLELLQDSKMIQIWHLYTVKPWGKHNR